MEIVGGFSFQNSAIYLSALLSVFFRHLSQRNRTVIELFICAHYSDSPCNQVALGNPSFLNVAVEIRRFNLTPGIPSLPAHWKFPLGNVAVDVRISLYNLRTWLRNPQVYHIHETKTGGLGDLLIQFTAVPSFQIDFHLCHVIELRLGERDLRQWVKGSATHFATSLTLIWTTLSPENREYITSLWFYIWKSSNPIKIRSSAFISGELYIF